MKIKNTIIIDGKRGHPEKIYLIQGKSGLRVEFQQVEEKELIES